jgi:hypothetical protein
MAAALGEVPHKKLNENMWLNPTSSRSNNMQSIQYVPGLPQEQ